MYVNVFDSTGSWNKWTAWTHWVEIHGGGTTDVALAAAAFSNGLYLFAKGVNNNKLIYVNIFSPEGN